jgi:3-hydroxyisobutyrate dehydrogenase-like beta-hydroxyacid dehydrogenase
MVFPDFRRASSACAFSCSETALVYLVASFIAPSSEIRSLHTPVGLDWHHKAESVIVGPKASLTVYEVEGFRGEERTFPPGFEVRQLRKDLGFIQSIDALKLSCKQ